MGGGGEPSQYFNPETRETLSFFKTLILVSYNLKSECKLRGKGRVLKNVGGKPPPHPPTKPLLRRWLI